MNQNPNMNKDLPPIVDSPEATAVHLSYIRRDIVDIKTQLTALTSGYVTHSDFNEVKEDHESRIRLIEKDMWKRISLSSAISAIGSSGLITLAQHLLK